MKYRKIN